MGSVFDRQLDYIYFFYGFSFLLVAQACFLARKAGRKEDLPWIWLGLFGLVHGLNEWLGLAALTADSEAFAIIRLGALAVSYLFLLEFGRAGSAEQGGIEGKRWLFLPLIAAASLGANAGIPGLSSAIRYSLGLIGSLWAAYAFFLASRSSGPGSRWLKALGALTALSGFLSGFIVDKAPFFPASAINNDSFMSVLHFPVLLAKTAVTISLAFSLVGYNRARACSGNKCDRQECSFGPFITVMAIMAIGWAVTQMVGNYGEGIAKKNFLARAKTAASVINPDDVARLSGTPADDGSPVFEQIRGQLQSIRAMNMDCRFVYLLGMKDGKIKFLADAEPKASKDYSPPGQVYTDAKPRDYEDFRKANSTVYDPYKDSWGTWVTSAAYLKDNTGKVVAQLGMDMNASDWVKSVSVYRLFSIIITFVLCGFSVMFYTAWFRSRESAERGIALRLASQRLEDEKRLRALTRALGEGVIVEEQGKITFANPEAEHLLGWSEEELAGEELYKTLICRDAENRKLRPEDFPTSKAISAGMTIRSDDLSFTRRDGSVFPVSCVCSPIMGDEGADGAVLTFQDITARRELDRQKSDFYAMVTQDLKSPLSIIQGYSDILLIERRQRLDPDTIKIVTNIWESCGRLLRLVNDFLTVSRLEFGKLSLNESFESVSSVLSELEEAFSSAAKRKDISFYVDSSHDLPRTVFDRAYVHRALYSLVYNAFSCSAAGGSVGVKAETSVEDGSEFIRVSVTDSGPGIPKEEAGKVFEIYNRSPYTAGGLGLAIAKGVAAAHGGRVGLESVEGSGSTFEFLLPVKKI